jgi:C4-dicarboxylate-binding protein DctP
VVTSTEFWDGLPGDVRDQLATILAEVTATRNAASTAVDDEAKASILAAGGVIRALTAEQRTAWVEAMKPVWAQFEGDVGADLIQAATSFSPTN